MADTKVVTDEVLTLHQAAKLMKVSGKTLWAQVRAGAVPHFRVGKQYRFHRDNLLAWSRGAESSASRAAQVAHDTPAQGFEIETADKLLERKSQ